MLNGLLHNLCSKLPGFQGGGIVPSLRSLRKGPGASAPRPGRQVCRGPQERPASRNLLKPAAAGLISLLFLMQPHTAHSITPTQGDRIITKALFSAKEITAVATSMTVTVVIPTPPKIELLEYAPQLAGAELVNVAPGAYRTGSDSGAAVVSMPLPVPAGLTTPIALDKPVPLVPTTIIHGGEPIFVRVTAADHNLDPTTADTIWVTITDDTSGDKEIIRLAETGPNTGVFTGYIRTTIGSSSASYNGSLPVTAGGNIKATFTDSFYGASVTSSTVVDPYGIVFDSLTGKPIDGAAITLINVATGQPAAVFGDDGVSKFPTAADGTPASSVISGSTAYDSSGRRYDFPPGGFRFPYVESGTYRLQVTPPPGYTGTSTVSFATLQALPGGPFTLVDPGSLGGQFVVNPGPALHLDIPLDPLKAALWLQKSAGKDTVAVGDFLPYQLDLANLDTAAAASGVTITDTLPLGFRYRHGSTKFGGVAAADPAISPDGRTLTFTVGSLAPKATVSIRYVVEVAAGARPGTATNYAVATSRTEASNQAQAAVQVRSDFLDSRSVVMGEVIAGACGAPDPALLKGVAGVRIFLEDGTFVDTDKRGMFHFEGVRPGSHVVQLDLDSLPAGYRVVPCEKNTRFAGSAYSQFVDVQGGSLWRADFHVARKAVADNAKEAGADRPDGAGVASSKELAAAAGNKDENGVKENPGVLSPRANAILVHSINGVRVCIPSALSPRLTLDGKEVPAERIGFSMKDSHSGKALYSYIGVDFGAAGEHTLRLQGLDPFGNARFDQTVKVTRSGDIAAIRLKSADGNVADGKTPVRLQLELLDAAGKVIPAEAELEIRAGTLKPFKENSAVPGAEAGTKGERLHVDQKGVVQFQPVNASGLYRVTLAYNKASIEAETYVKPVLRDWILVGLGEGTVGYNAVAGHMESLRESGTDGNLYEDGRLAFYAKGKVKGEWLLTAAYDSAKGKGDTGNASLFQTIDPNTYYTLYGDASLQQYDAASARKIYLKIERDQFYALFGDFDTGLTVTELSRYSRRLNGVKAEWQGKNFEANVFGTDTAQAYARDEIQGDGTSGLYHLSRKNIVLNSDKITIETRDRFHSEVILNSQTLSRFTDYSIDYDAGTIFFKQPVRSRDENFNPIFIVAEYETLNAGTKALTYGGRVGAKLLDNNLKAGVTYIHEGEVSGGGNLYGLDASYKIGAATTVKGEVARTDTDFGGDAREGNAWLAELEHQTAKLQGKLYFRQQDNGFGLGQQNGSETGTRKAGGDATYKLSDTVSLGGQAYRQYNLTTGAVEDIVEGKTTYTSGPYGAHLGLRYAGDRLEDGSSKTSTQLTMGGSWLTLNKRLTLHVDHDQSIGGNDNASFPTRTTFGADLKLTDKVSLFAQQEITSGAGANTNTTSAGIKANPWQGGAVNTSLGQNLDENGERVFALFGLKQSWKITDKWSVDGGLDRSQTIAKPGNYQFNGNVSPASGVATSGASQDFTAVSLGTSYKERKWNWDSRLEVRTATSEDKWGIVSAYVGEPREGWGWSARCQLFDTREADGSSKLSGDLRLGLAYRPLYTRWIILNRLDLLDDRQRGGAANTTTTNGTTVTSLDSDNRRIVNNLSANCKLDGKFQVSLFYGAKYLLESIDSRDYSGFTDLAGIEGRYDLAKDWDIGIRGSVLHSWSAGQVGYSAGPSVGYNVIRNAWVSIGYNLVGFSDKDFSAADYTAQGPFIRFRFKFDQNSVREAANWIANQ